jgi:alkanesulfonate monooxygenase SsuD/methylene tetrahydromethanopterin reductase-like flavin-dependent oxidoreductase (luciferase family)
VDPSLRLAVELPPAPAPGRRGTTSLEPWWQTALAAVRAGAGVVWFTGGPSSDDPERAPDCDACTVAGAAVPLVTTALLGVVSSVPVDRHPAIVARDVTTLDVVSGGRGALLLRWAATGPPGEPARALPDGLPSACQYLGEAVAVCSAVLRDDDPVFEGRYLHVAGAVERPPPTRPDGPALFVEVPAGTAGLVRREAGPAFLLRQAVGAGAAIVCPDDPGEIASWRAMIDDAAAALWTREDPAQVPAVVCRTTVRHAWSNEEWATERTLRRGAVGRLDAARAAGAEGVVVRLRSGRRGDGTLHVDAGDGERIAEQLAGCFEPWRR